MTKTNRWIVLVVAFLGWGLAGIHLGITTLVMRVATASLLPATAAEGEIGEWFGWLVCAFLFGAALGDTCLACSATATDDRRHWH